MKTIIIAYAIIQACSLFSSSEHELSDKVNNMIKDGWQPIGGVYCQRDKTCYQAMVKTKYVE